MLRPYPTPLPSFRSYRENRHAFDRLARSLRVEVERPERLDVVSPPLEPRRCRHPKPIHVENHAPHAELRHFRDSGDPSVTHRFQPLDRVAEGTAPRSPLPISQDET